MSSRYVQVINGNLLDAKEKYLLHQCNCVSTNARGIAEQIFYQFPYANTYVDNNRKPNTIDIKGNGTSQRYIINMYSQYYPGGPQYQDTTNIRVEWFRQCLDRITQIPQLESIAMPYNIGCGLARGDWSTYYSIICQFADKVRVPVILYKI